MVIRFEKENLWDNVPEVRNYYEAYIALLAKNILSLEELEQIDAIVIPDDFVAGVTAYQQKNKIAEAPVTNNEHARAYGKMLFSPLTQKYSVYIDFWIAEMLIDDNVFSACNKSLDETELDCLKNRRARAHNLFAHELVHISFDIRMKLLRNVKPINSGLDRFIYILFDEYNACRVAASYFPLNGLGFDKEYISALEEEINNYKPEKRNNRQFLPLFLQNTQMALVHLASCLGSNETGKVTQLPLGGTVVGKHASTLRNIFDNCFCQLQDSNIFVLPKEAVNVVKSYYADLGVNVKESIKGLYFSY